MSWFVLFSIAGWLAVVVAARVLRGTWFSRFAAVVIGIHVASTVGLRGAFEPIWPVVLFLQAAVFIHFGSLTRPRLRPVWWRALISIPGLFFSAGAFLAIPWAIVAALGYSPHFLFVPFALAGVGLVQSMFLRKEEVVVDLAPDRINVDGGVQRHPAGQVAGAGSLRVVQITDPHLGPFMSPQRLHRICQRAVDRNPDLILLTGDFLTMEAHDEVEAASYALAPLAALEGRVFACLGNHDLEAPETVSTALARAKVPLLVDDEAVVQTRVGPVQILGMDFKWRNRAAHLTSVCAQHPRRPGHLRLVLLHDPSAFHQLPPAEADLVLSGHTHGGQLGLVSLGLPWTFLSFFPQIPDHGLWARGRDRLYVHRGTGHYGFPLRLGVPGEESLMHVNLS